MKRRDINSNTENKHIKTHSKRNIYSTSTPIKQLPFHFPRRKNFLHSKAKQCRHQELGHCFALDSLWARRALLRPQISATAAKPAKPLLLPLSRNGKIPSKIHRSGNWTGSAPNLNGLLLWECFWNSKNYQNSSTTSRVISKNSYSWPYPVVKINSKKNSLIYMMICHPDQHQNPIGWCWSPIPPFQNKTISSKFLHNFLSYPTDRQTNTRRQKHNLLGRGNKVRGGENYRHSRIH